MTVIRIKGLVTGRRTAFDGQFLVDYDPGSNGREPGTQDPMTCRLVTTPDRASAKEMTPAEAFELWKRVDPRQPTRPDGQPNRPLTAFTVEFIR
jgi:hypothetical protein